MKYYDWSEVKNSRLKIEREICFEDIVVVIGEGKLIDVIIHHNPEKYPNQKVYIVAVQDYIFLVPFVEEETKIFLKTIYPSRKLTKKYLKGEES